MTQNCGICGSFLPKLADEAGKRVCPKCGTEFEAPNSGPVFKRGGPDSPMVCGACPDWRACADAGRCARATDDDYKLPSYLRRKW